MDFKRFGKSFRFASKGLFAVIRDEQNIKIYLLIGLINILLGVFTHLNYLEWAVIIITVATCLGVEIINISLEELLDMISPEYNGRTKIIKDIAAAAALATAIAAVVVAALIYLSHWF